MVTKFMLSASIQNGDPNIKTAAATKKTITKLESECYVNLTIE